MNLRLPEDLQRDLKAFAHATGQDEAAIVEAAIRRYLVIEQFRQLRRATLPIAEKAGIRTDEDVFRLIS